MARSGRGGSEPAIAGLGPEEGLGVAVARDQASRSLRLLERWAWLQRGAAVVAWVAIPLTVGPWPAYRGPNELGSSALPLTLGRLAAVVFLASSGAWVWKLASLIEERQVAPERAWRTQLATHSALALVVLAMLGRGVESRALLMGPVALLPVLLSVSLIGAAVAAVELWQLGRHPLVGQLLADLPSGSERAPWVSRLPRWSALVLLAALIWLELRPLPLHRMVERDSAQGAARSAQAVEP